MKIETTHQKINSSSKEVFIFLTDMNNFQKLLPDDKIENWKSTNEECSFRIKGMTDIGMKRTTSTPNSLINIVSHGKVPFPFTLNIHLSEENNTTTAYLVFDGEVNPFMVLMVEKPLTNFFNMLAEKLVKAY